MLNNSGTLKCKKDLIKSNGERTLTKGNEYNYWKGKNNYWIHNDLGQPHYIYKESDIGINKDNEEFLEEFFEIVK